MVENMFAKSIADKEVSTIAEVAAETTKRGEEGEAEITEKPEFVQEQEERAFGGEGEGEKLSHRALAGTASAVASASSQIAYTVAVVLEATSYQTPEILSAATTSVIATSLSGSAPSFLSSLQIALSASGAPTQTTKALGGVTRVTQPSFVVASSSIIQSTNDPTASPVPQPSSANTTIIPGLSNQLFYIIVGAGGGGILCTCFALMGFFLYRYKNRKRRISQHGEIDLDYSIFMRKQNSKFNTLTVDTHNPAGSREIHI